MKKNYKLKMESIIIENGLKMEIIEIENGFYPESTINGNIIILNKEINTETIILQLKRKQYCNHKNLLNDIKIIKEKQINTQNYTKIDFTFEIPEELEPSFEYYNDNTFIYLRYYLEAKCISNNQLYNCTYIILIKAKYINRISNINFNTKNGISRFFTDKGECSCNIYIDKNCFTFDEILKLNIEIDNTKCSFDISKFKATIIREVIVTSFNKEKIHYEKTINGRETKEVLIKKGTFNNQTMDIKIKDNENFNINKWKNPYNNNDKKILKFIPSVDTLYIKCIYKIKFTIYFDAFLLSSDYRPRIFIPIYISHQSKEEFDRIQNKKSKSVFNSDQLINGFKSLNENIDDYKKSEIEDNNFIY